MGQNFALGQFIKLVSIMRFSGSWPAECALLVIPFCNSNTEWVLWVFVSLLFSHSYEARVLSLLCLQHLHKLSKKLLKSIGLHWIEQSWTLPHWDYWRCMFITYHYKHVYNLYYILYLPLLSGNELFNRYLDFIWNLLLNTELWLCLFCKGCHFSFK